MELSQRAAVPTGTCTTPPRLPSCAYCFASMHCFQFAAAHWRWPISVNVGMGSIRRAVALCKAQEALGGTWVFEHPAGCTAWELPIVKQLVDRSHISVEVLDMCTKGMTFTMPDGREVLVKKPTQMVSNHPTVGECIRGR